MQLLHLAWTSLCCASRLPLLYGRIPLMVLSHDWSSRFADAFRYVAVGWEEPLDEDWKPEPAVTRFNPYTGQAY